ncbi:AAA family ATPase [Yimella sp. cx-573]|nr:AAA family ATPase [Yimella sp. cx-573]
MTAQPVETLTVDLVEARRFIERVYGDAPGFLSVCHKVGDRFPSSTVDDIDGALCAIERADRAHPEGIYLRATTMATRPLTGRGGAADARALVGLWADVDFGTVGHAHNEANLPNPPDDLEAARIVDTSGLPTPSLWVHSGGGLYPWWILDQPLELDDTTRPIAASLSTRWQQTLEASAERLGYHYGAGVGDLARVLRVPGTINRKAGGERSCFILDDTGEVYAFEDLLAACPAPPAPTEPPARPARVTLSVDPFNTGPSAFDLLDEHVTFADLLTGAGWAIHDTRHPAAIEQCFTRPGNPESNCSAHTLTAQPNVLVVHSTSARLPAGGGQKLTRGRVFAHLHHSGDERAAALDLYAAIGGRPCTAAAAALPLPRTHFEASRVTATVNDHPNQADDARDDAYEQQLRHQREVSEAVRRLRVQAEAREAFRREQEPTAEAFDAGYLGDILARPNQQAWRAEGLLPADGSTLIVAQRKTGKTTLTLGLARSLITGEDALGRFTVDPITGNVAILNYEVSGTTLAGWAHDLGIPTDRLILVNLRGRRNPLTHPEDAERLAAYLREHDTETLIVDPFGRAYNGQSQNDPGEVGAWLTNLDRIARTDIGARDLILTAHAGWNGERTRGSSALEDWADSIITLTRTDDRDDDRRYLHALGRDVDIDEDQLEYRTDTRQLVLTGNGSRKQAKAESKTIDLALAVVRAVTANPGINGTQLALALRNDADAPSFRKGDETKAVEYARDQGHIRTEYAGPGKPKLHYPTSPNLPQTLPGEPLPTSPTPPYKGGVGGTGTSDLPTPGGGTRHD